LKSHWVLLLYSREIVPITFNGKLSDSRLSVNSEGDIFSCKAAIQILDDDIAKAKEILAPLSLYRDFGKKEKLK
jgi:hypothetical protein